jgi:hypothetical protein
MRKRLFLLTLSAIVLLCATWALAGPPVKMSAPGENKKSEKNQPRVVVPQMEYVFDPVFEGVQIKHDFVIENRGTAPLVIKNVRPG